MISLQPLNSYCNAIVASLFQNAPTVAVQLFEVRNLLVPACTGSCPLGKNGWHKDSVIFIVNVCQIVTALADCTTTSPSDLCQDVLIL
mmetsp:Transcript_49074/g.106709  ORF Transcript_49074/g.106709 Transcript_49074/m.106709 type:complete len:88 (+) Transcript_49074:217-480(+)